MDLVKVLVISNRPRYSRLHPILNLPFNYSLNCPPLGSFTITKQTQIGSYSLLRAAGLNSIPSPVPDKPYIHQSHRSGMQYACIRCAILRKVYEMLPFPSKLEWWHYLKTKLHANELIILLFLLSKYFVFLISM